MQKHTMKHRYDKRQMQESAKRRNDQFEIEWATCEMNGISFSFAGLAGSMSTEAYAYTGDQQNITG